ncbi:MAG: alpha/beta hydrolase [Leptolyngbya sp. SIOISBB]|nr:alpha/beta hydrolase [Leptolyngbya sp. SIOISBB]
MTRAIPFGQVRRLLAIALTLGVVYSLAIAFIATRQRHLIYRPRAELSMLPSYLDFGLTYEDVWISVGGSGDRLHGWWLPATAEKVTILPDEPAQVLSSPKVMLYFVGVGRNIGDYNYLARVSAFRQLGFSVLVLDYRGYGRSRGAFPNEAQLYEDAQAAWQYLRHDRQIPTEQIVIYGESLGGAIALDLAIQQPDAAGLIMQSSFTSMTDAVRHKAFTRLLPIDQVLTERFESLEKIGSLNIPVLFLHGEADSVVPQVMSRRLYEAAPHPKQLFLIPEADHVSIYQPGDASYLRAIATFVATLP